MIFGHRQLNMLRRNDIATNAAVLAVAIALAFGAVAAQVPNETGVHEAPSPTLPIEVGPSYVGIVRLNKIDVPSGRAFCNYRLLLTVPAGDGYVLVPLPFWRGVQQAHVVPDPNADTQLVLTGYILPAENTGAVVVSQRAIPQRIAIEFADVQFPTRADPDKPGRIAVAVYLRQAHLDIAPLAGGAKIALPSSLQYDSREFTDSRPSASATEFSDQRSIALTVPSDAILYLSSAPSRPYALLLFLFPLSIIVGLLTGPRFVVTRRAAIVVVVTTLALLIALVIVLFVVVPPELRYADTTVIGTAGTLSGLLLAVLYVALRAIVMLRPLTPPPAVPPPQAPQ